MSYHVPGAVSPPTEGLSRWTPMRIAVVAICLLLNAIDGMDIVIMSYVAPALKSAWQLSPEVLGTVFSASLAGMAIGGLFIAPLADRFGRRPLIIALLSVITVAMLLSSQVGNVFELIVLRTIIGMSVGAFLASVTTMAADYAPRGQQGIVVAVAIAGYPLGAVITGLIAAHMLPVWGWHGMLAAAGVVSLIVLPLVIFILPESIDYLKPFSRRTRSPGSTRSCAASTNPRSPSCRLGKPHAKCLCLRSLPMGAVSGLWLCGSRSSWAS